MSVSVTSVINHYSPVKYYNKRSAIAIGLGPELFPSYNHLLLYNCLTWQSSESTAGDSLPILMKPGKTSQFCMMDYNLTA